MTSVSLQVQSFPCNGKWHLREQSGILAKPQPCAGQSLPPAHLNILGCILLAVSSYDGMFYSLQTTLLASLKSLFTQASQLCVLQVSWGLFPLRQTPHLQLSEDLQHCLCSSLMQLGISSCHNALSSHDVLLSSVIFKQFCIQPESLVIWLLWLQ